MNEKNMNQTCEYVIVTAGSTYLDIDAYACTVALAELLRLKGVNAIAYSEAPCNYSVCNSLSEDEHILKRLPSDFEADKASYIIVDVSDPDYIKNSAPLDRITELYDHHVGFENYWQEHIGKGAHIEFIGAAATLIYREWKKSGLHSRIKRTTALLLIAAILDNTLNLTSSNTTEEDKETFNELCEKANIDENWCSEYFYEVQTSVESDLKIALFSDMKKISNSSVLPSRVVQLCVWDAERLLEKLPVIRRWFEESPESWMINIIDIKHQISYFVCDDGRYQKRISEIFDVEFGFGVAKTKVPYLRKEIIKKTIKNQQNSGG